MKEEKIFTCQDINWEKVNFLFEEMAGKRPPGPLGTGPMLTDLAIISYHVSSCATCKTRLLGLAKSSGLNLTSSLKISFPKHDHE